MNREIVLCWRRWRCCCWWWWWWSCLLSTEWLQTVNMSSSKASRPYYLDGISLVHCAIPVLVKHQSLHLLVPAGITGMGELICLTKISLRLELQAVELTFLRWTEILFYVTVAGPSGELPWEKQHLSPFYRKNSEQSCCLVFPNAEFCHGGLKRERETVSGVWTQSMESRV